MKLEAAEYKLHDSYPVLDLVIDGQSARVFYPKRTLLDLGYVFLGPEWAGRVPAIILPEDRSLGRGEKRLEGFTNDSTIVALARQLVNDELTLGPIPV